MSEKGKFVISLDFELFWGVRDVVTIDDYGENILGVQQVMPRLLDMFRSYDVKATFATVGLLFASNKEEILEYAPKIKPQYNDPNLSPYNGHFDLMKDSEDEDKYHYASEEIELLKKYPEQEISTHTFSHYYCNSEGQTVDDFRRDIEAAIAIAKRSGVELKSLVFPRNMFNQDYIEVCEENGISSYRGNERVWFHRSDDSTGLKELSKRAFRLLNSYINIAGHHCYSDGEMTKSRPYDIPASRFLRPYSTTLKIFEGLRKARIMSSMTYAAKNNLMFHLWWHPHNFGKNQDENFKFLEDILLHYKKLNKAYGFESITMSELADQFDAKR